MCVCVGGLSFQMITESFNDGSCNIFPLHLSFIFLFRPLL